MTDALLLFTFSPVQSFIAEARRAADLYTGSQILVELAKAAGNVIQKHAEGGKLIYPAELSDDVPNKLVAKVPFEEIEKIAEDARKELLRVWKEEIAQKAREAFEEEIEKHNKKFPLPAPENIPPLDDATWNRHIGDDYLWEIYWSAAKLDGRDYKTAYKEAEDGLVATKFTRPFSQPFIQTDGKKEVGEFGFKDTLSGKREALHAKNQSGREYWFQVGQVGAVTPIKIRPSVDDPRPERRRPRERLDAIGVIKRFRSLEDETKAELAPFRGFPSTSSMASWTFLESARDFAKDKLADHRHAVKKLLPAPKYEVRPTDPDWSFDGDLLYPETMRVNRMKSDYGKTFSEDDLKPAGKTLDALFKALRDKREELRKQNDARFAEIFTRPSPYYAIIVLDGDNMGKYIVTLDEDGHRRFSADLRNFSAQVSGIEKKHNARVIYNGGDDVLALAPLVTAFDFALELAQTFEQKTARTASAGIALSHHLSPLGTALRAARRAERRSKELRETKNAVCIHALKRSGEPIEVRSGWDEVEPFKRMIEYFIKDEISTRLPYDVARAAYALPNADDKFEAELRRLLKRHWQKGKEEDKAASSRDLSLDLRKWAESFPKADSPSQTEELAGWLALARFIAKGGRE